MYVYMYSAMPHWNNQATDDALFTEKSLSAGCEVVSQGKAESGVTREGTRPASEQPYGTCTQLSVQCPHSWLLFR